MIGLLVGFIPIHEQAEAYAATLEQAEPYVGTKTRRTAVCLLALGSCVTPIGYVTVAVWWSGRSSISKFVTVAAVVSIVEVETVVGIEKVASVMVV